MSSKDLGVRASQKAQTRAALKQAAAECFRSLGYRNTQVSDIARRAGVAHGTFYVHFDTREALIDELLADFNQSFVQVLQVAWSEHGPADPRRSARRLAEACLDFWSQERELLVAFADRLGAADRLMYLRDGISPPAATFLADRLAEVAALSGRELRDPDLVAQGLLGLWTRVGLQHLFGPHDDREAAVEVLSALSLGALAALIPPLRPFVFAPGEEA